MKFIKILFLTLFIASSSYAGGDVKVGYLTYAPFVSKVDKKNDFKGTMVDLWTKIKQKLGYKEVFSKAYQSVVEAQKALSSGEIDIIIGPVTVLPQRAKKHNFTVSIMTDFNIVAVVKSDKEFFPEPSKLKIGIEDTDYGNFLTNYFNFNDKDVKKFKPGSYDKEILEALKKGNIDAVICEYGVLKDSSSGKVQLKSIPLKPLKYLINNNFNSKTAVYLSDLAFMVNADKLDLNELNSAILELNTLNTIEDINEVVSFLSQ